MQPIRNNFRPAAGGAYSDYRPPLLATGPRPLLSMHGNERLTSSGARSDEGQTIPLPVGVMARGHQAGFGGRDQASEKAEAEKYTALFSRMLQENIFLSGLSNPALPRAVSPPSSTILPRLNPTQQMGQMQDGFGRHRHPGPVTPNRMSFQGPCHTTGNLAEAPTVPADLLGWTTSSTPHQGLTSMTLPPPPVPLPSFSSSVNRLASIAPPGHLYTSAALPIGVQPPVSSQYHPPPTMNSFTPSGPRWSSTPASSVVPVRGCSGRSTDVTASREVAEGEGGGFLRKSLEGLQSSDIILSRANQMLAQNLFEMTSTKNHDDNNNNETTIRHRDSHDSRSTYSSSQGRSEDGAGGGRRRRRSGSRGEGHHRKKRRSRRRSRSSYSSTSAESTPSSSSSSSVVNANSGHQHNAERNYRNRLDDNKSSTRRKSEFCRICEIKIKGSFLAHRRGKAHIRKESSVQSGCDLCGVRCFNTFSEYETHRSSEEHLQRRSDQQNQIDLENRKRLGLPETKVVIIRNADGRKQEEELEKLDRLRKMTHNRNRNRISGEEEEEDGKKQEEEDADRERRNGKNVKETELEARCCSTDIKDGRNSSEWNAGGTNGPEVMSLVRCLDDQDDDVIIDLTGRSEEEGGKQMEDVERSSEVKVVAVKEKDDVTRLMNDHTQVTSTTADKTSKDDCLGREWIVPVTGFFCKVCLKFFSANSGESDVTAHCTSSRHRDYYQEHVTRAKRNQSSSTSTSFPSSSIPSSTSSSSSTLVSPPNAGRCGIVYDEKKRVKEIIIWRNSENAPL